MKTSNRQAQIDERIDQPNATAQTPGTIARIGSPVLWRDEAGEVIDLTEHAAKVRFVDGSEADIEYRHLSLRGVQPDRDWLARKAQAQAEPRRTLAGKR